MEKGLPINASKSGRRSQSFSKIFGNLLKVICVLGIFTTSWQRENIYNLFTSNEDIDYKELYLKTLETNLASNWSKIYIAEPHLAGTNLGLVNFTRDKFEEYGLKASTDVYDILVSYPKSHDLNLLDAESGDLLYKAPLKEDVIKEDSTTEGDDLVPTFLGYAANGNVTGQYVYANYGSMDDFAKLKELGVDVTGKIVVVRYGGLFRGLKVKFAQDNGAIGVLLYSDPGDDHGITEANGYKQYPKGPARQESSVQRGSVQFLGGKNTAPGDPTTPGYASKPGAVRVDPHDSIGKIPALPISYREVKPILKALNGHGVNLTDDSWIGALEGFDYFTGPSKLVELNLYSDQDFKITPLTNVYGEVDGVHKNEVIVIGNHRDAWIKGGAGDPNSGSSALVEIARGLGELQAKGYKFQRPIVLMSWDGEEYGLLGSTEYGEYASKYLQKNVVAYLNVDVAASGTKLNLEGCPSLFKLLKSVAKELEYPEEGVGSLFDHYISNHGDHLTALGSGSDYTVFLEHLGIPSVDMGFTQDSNDPVYHYHSNYDSYHWMEKYGDKGFVYHNLMAKYLGLVALKLSDSAVLEFSLGDYGKYLVGYLQTIKDEIPKDWLKQEITDKSTWRSLLINHLDDINFTRQVTNKVYKLDSILPFPEYLGKSECPHHKGHMMIGIEHHKNATLDDLVNRTFEDAIMLMGDTANFDNKSEELRAAYDNRQSLPFWRRIKLYFEIKKHNKLAQYFERNFLVHEGLHERSWFQHMVYASGRYTGYAGQTFPILQEPIEDKDFNRLVVGFSKVSKAFRRISGELKDN